MSARALQVTLLVGTAALVVLEHRATPFDALFEKLGPPRGVSANLLRAIARIESSFNPSAVSPRNRNGTVDRGLMQINDATAVALGRDPGRMLEPEYAIATAVEYLVRIRAELGEQFDTFSWIAAYNAGAPAVKRGFPNVAYTSMVAYHLLGYELASQVRALGAAA